MSVRVGPVRFYGAAAFAWWLLGCTARALTVTVGAAVAHPRTTAAITAAGVTLWAVVEHPVVTALVVLAVALPLESWAVLFAASFRERVALRALAWWRSVVLYRRLWARAMHAAGLDLDDERLPPRWRLPRFAGVRCTGTHDVVRVRGLLGQTFDAWEAAGPMLAHVFGARDVWVARGDDRRLTLELERGRRGRAWSS